jgi:hypothetical protein
MNNNLMQKFKNLLNNNSKINISTYEGLNSIISINKGASEEELNKTNSYFNKRLPGDYLNFLKTFNGIELFRIENFIGFKFYDCDSLINNDLIQRKEFGEDWNENIIQFCSCLGDGDHIGFKIFDDLSYKIADCFHEELPNEWKTSTYNFDDFLEKLVDMRGKKFWL